MHFKETCPDCKTDIKIVKEAGGWVAYNSTDKSYGPHKCSAVKNCKEFLRISGYYGCRSCGRTVRFVHKNEQKFVLGLSGRRHQCDERLLAPKDRYWSRDWMSPYPWEYSVVDGTPTIIIRETHPRRKDMPKGVKVVPVDEWVLSEEDRRYFDELYPPNAPQE